MLGREVWKTNQICPSQSPEKDLFAVLPYDEMGVDSMPLS